MASTVHMATPEDDRRHLPGPDSLPLWNESLWFPFYDPQQEIGVVFRIGMYPNRGEANLFLFLTHRGAVVHSLVDLRAPLPPMEAGRLGLHGLLLEWDRPLERFRIRYRSGGHGLDVTWEAVSPTYLYPAPPGTTADQVPRHIEQGGAVTGTVTIADTSYPIACPAHRDHSWGGERDWAKFYRWNYLSGEFGRDVWFNAVRIAFGPDMSDIFVGCLWDGHELLELKTIAMDVETADGGSRQLGVDARLTDERGREHHIVGEEVLVIAPVQFGRTWLRDGFTRYRYGERVGYGILEHGYVEEG
jgi:hypothetical protein